MKNLPIEKDTVLKRVGGIQEEVKEFRGRHQAENIVMAGQKPHNEIPLYLAAADVLVLPNSAKAVNPRYQVYATYDTSPLKLFEYMASRRPIVASGLPSIKEILNESNAVLFEPDNSDSLVRGIEQVFENQEASHARADQAQQDVAQYSLRNSARAILNFIK